jgi:hypothetical protein
MSPSTNPAGDGHKKKKKTKAIIENLPDIPDHNDNIRSVPYYVAPMDTINLNDDSVVNLLSGTESAPIYVSDYEDCSEVAIKGERKNKATYSAKPPNLAKVQEDTDDSTAASPQLFEDLLAPPGESKKTSPKRKPKRKSSSGQTAPTPTSQMAFRKDNDAALSGPAGASSLQHLAQGLASPISAVSKDPSALKSASVSATTAKTKNNETSKRTFPSFGKKKKDKKLSKSKNPVHIDVTALADEDEDPILEKELEEIALHGGRSGLISGTPGKDAFDLEHGKGPRRFGGFGRNNRRVGIATTTIKVAHKPGYRDDPSVTYVDEEEDEADKSWHGIVKYHPNKKRWTKRKIIWTVAELALVLVMLIVLSVVIANNNRKSKPGDPLTAEQQQIHDILTRVTGPKILTDLSTPQHLARQWLLYEDDEVKTAGEEQVIQRYALAVFHFATGGGDKHWVANNWLIGPECGNADREPWFGLDCNSDGEVRSMVFGTCA